MMDEEKIKLPEIWGEWEIEKELGNGSYGTVFLAKRRLEGHDFYSAIRVIDIPHGEEFSDAGQQMSDEEESQMCFHDIQEKFEKEIEWLYSLRNNVNINFIEDFQVEKGVKDWRIFARMEYLQSFDSYIRSTGEISEEEAIKLAIDICMALTSFEEENVIHRSIKPNNILRSETGIYKLGDFDVLNASQRSKETPSSKETFTYMAPELVKGERYNCTVDLYSLGIVLYQLMNHGRLPLESMLGTSVSDAERESAWKRRTEGEGFDRPANASVTFSNIIMKACAYDPMCRYQSAAEMKADLVNLQKTPRVNTSADESVKKDPKGKARKVGVVVGTAAIIAVAAVGGYFGGGELITVMSNNAVSESNIEPEVLTEEQTEIQTEIQAESQTEKQSKKKKKKKKESDSATVDAQAEDQTADATEPVYEVTSAGNLNVRATPDADGELLTKFSPGELVTGTGEESDNWIQIYYTPEGADTAETGWVSGNYLNEVPITSAEIAETEGSELLIKTITEAETEQPEQETESTVSYAKTSKMTEEEIQQGATDLLNELIECSVSDTEKFNSLWIEASNEDIQYYQEALANIYYEHYAKQIVKVAFAQDPYFQVYTCCYTVAGTYPNTSFDNSTFNFIMCYTDDGWKVNSSEEALNAIETPDNMAQLSTPGYAEAYYAGRNCMSSSYGPLLDDTTVFEGAFDTSLAYLYQNEDGSVEALFWMANGTSTPVYVTQLSVTVTDDTLGIILDQTVSCDEMVNAGYTKLVQMHFEPDQVLTGTQTWTLSIHSDVNTQTRF